VPGAFPTSFARSGVACIAVIFLAGLAGGAGAAGKAAAKQAGGTGVPTGKEAATDKKPYFNLQDSIAAERARLRALPGRTGLLEEESRYSVFDEEVIIRDFFQDRRGGVFVDVGCAWPIQANNTYYLEHHLGWTGVGIDALDDYAAQWREKRSGAQFLNYLVTDQASEAGEFYRSQNLGLSSASKARADGRHFGGTLQVEKIEVPAATLNEILEEAGITRIDLLSLDIEGHEIKALRGLDLQRFQPELIVSEGSRPEVEALLASNGYERIERYVPFDRTNRYYRRRPADPSSSNPGPDAGS